MKEKLHSFMAAMLFSAGLISPVFAQTDVTNQYIVNPGFESENDPSTTSVSLTLEGWDRNYVEGYNWNGCNGDWYTEGARSYGIWKEVIDSDFELSQTLTVPNGIYTVTVDMTVSRVSASSRVNGQRLFANEEETYYPASAETPADNGDPYELSLTVRVTDGTLKIGIRTDGGTQHGIGWFKVDNFKLYVYDGDDGYLRFLKSQLNNLDSEIERNLEKIPQGTASQIREVRDDILLKLEGSSDIEIYEEVIAELKLIRSDMEPALEIYNRLFEMIEIESSELFALNYPGLAEFNEAFNKALVIFVNPEASVEDFENAIQDFEEAILIYKYSSFENASPTNPVDVTWMVKNADCELHLEGWDVDGFKTIDSGDNYEHFNHIFIEKWTGGGGRLDDASASQSFANIPNGTYNLSAAMIAVQQSDPDEEVTGVYLFANTTTRAANTGDGVGERFELNVVVTDGQLTLGVKTVNTTANWVGFDNVKLAYLGKDLAIYESAYEEQIAKAEAMIGVAFLLPRDENILKENIALAKAADRSTVEALEIVLTDLFAAIEVAEAEMHAYSTFKSGSYGKAVDIANNFDMVYAGELSNLIGSFIVSLDEIFEADTTTQAVFPALTTEIDRYLAFVAVYHALDIFKESVSQDELRDLISAKLNEAAAIVDEDDSKIEEAITYLEAYQNFATTYSATAEFAAENEYPEIRALLETLLDEQLEKVDVDVSHIQVAMKLFNAMVSFGKTYSLAWDVAHDEQYPEDKRNVLVAALEEEVVILEANLEEAAAAEIRLNKLIAEARFISISDGADMTSFLINPEIVADDEKVIPEGWEIERIIGNTNSATGQHWTGDGTNRYLDSWDGTPGALNYTAQQTVRGIPNGTYRLVAAVRSSGTGAYLFGKWEDGIKIQEIPVNDATGGNIWTNADPDEDPEIKAVNGGKGYGWNWVEVEDINVNTNSLSIGVSTNSEFTGGDAWTGNWFSADDFKLYYVNSNYWHVGVENIGEDSTAELIAYAVNGVIVVEGAETYSVYSLNGVQVPAKAQLASGIYIVKAGSKVTKVAVK